MAAPQPIPAEPPTASLVAGMLESAHAWESPQTTSARTRVEYLERAGDPAASGAPARVALVGSDVPATETWSRAWHRDLLWARHWFELSRRSDRTVARQGLILIVDNPRCATPEAVRAWRAVVARQTESADPWPTGRLGLADEVGEPEPGREAGRARELERLREELDALDAVVDGAPAWRSPFSESLDTFARRLRWLIQFDLVQPPLHLAAGFYKQRSHAATSSK
jgi:hypothetical protein